MNIKNITEEEWKFLIILDACRYDYFEKNYKKYFKKGTLQKTQSKAIETIEWAQKNFTKYYDDIIYISTIPFINSKKEIKRRGSTFNGKKHFYKVIDLWDWGWDNEIKTVRPEKVNETVEKELKNNPKKRFIIHYMQPHAPYISLEKLYKKYEENKKIKKTKKSNFTKKKLIYPFMKIFKTETIWRLNRIFGFREVLPPHMEMAWRLVGKKGLKKAYTDNLNIVLKNAQILCEKLEGKKIITADHGELLGENGLYGHGPPLPRHEKLLTIPWLTLNKN